VLLCEDAHVMERSRFGRTEHLSSRVIFGAAALARVDQETADRVLPLLLEHGVNHIDTAAAYGDAELRIAPWLAQHPGLFFVATKAHVRDGSGVRASLEQSLTRMGVDQVDLLQLHNLVEPEEWEVAHARGGALEAVVQAREEGLVRYIGVTGHGLRIARMHLRSLERFDYDSVLLPYNFVLLQEPGYRADVEELLTVCTERDVAVQTIKSIARRRWTEEAPAWSSATSWYEPLTDPEAIAHAVHHVLARPGLFLDSTSALDQLPHMLEAAASFREPSGDELAADVTGFGIRPLFDGGALERM
jgi:aryl-alcohol dehydrogenase-like predicted oxidoreductase